MRPTHGGDLAAAVDASVNINPLGPPAALDEVFASARALAERYPEIDARNARTAWAQELGLSVDELMIGNGASELISLAVRALAPERVVVFDPTYSEYANAAAVNGTPVHRIRALRDETGVWSPPGDPAIGPGDLVFVCSPNNPTGMVVGPDTIENLAATGARVVVDESFRALMAAPQPSAISLRENGVITLTSLTKSYAVPGLRLGHLIAERKTVAALERRRDPWSVNGIAAAAAVALVGCGDYLAEARDLIMRERNRVAAALAAHGLVVYEADVPWLLVDVPTESGHDATSFVGAVRERGVALRDASNFPGLTTGSIRIGIRTAQENDRVLGAIGAALAEGGGA